MQKLTQMDGAVVQGPELVLCASDAACERAREKSQSPGSPQSVTVCTRTVGLWQVSKVFVLSSRFASRSRVGVLVCCIS